jgi:hypothetical protein
VLLLRSAARADVQALERGVGLQLFRESRSALQGPSVDTDAKAPQRRIGVGGEDEGHVLVVEHVVHADLEAPQVRVVLQARKDLVARVPAHVLSRGELQNFGPGRSAGSWRQGPGRTPLGRRGIRQISSANSDDEADDNVET